MRLYHTGYQEIRKPDIYRGRRNADFGQGFYLTADRAFSERWAKEKKGSEVYVNQYELDTDGLIVKCFERDMEWFRYLADNRGGRPDRLAGCDVIAGPIANDTIYDVMGIITSGFLTPEESLKLLRIGPAYRQVVLKTEKAAARLAFLSAGILPPEKIAASRILLREEEEDYRRKLAEALETE
ncbi:MAG: DUF3990 domain-containing protein [Lachnospiraceae bacterium]|nr:DUF3990 domain-containing protein [Lachnospiraceae bacterium]